MLFSILRNIFNYNYKNCILNTHSESCFKSYLALIVLKESHEIKELNIFQHHE